ncbi:hypothetical protein DYB32_001395 [Aphanomyces invadans]|uniref:Uncharacterized protein n=1 Tax=Aphanomyces invadans TaxID=157072 RepID=A0A3R6YEX8_9STRA|nr:hypothetical protein DYB32_001395 [Aphanomyces invadans]
MVNYAGPSESSALATQLALQGMQKEVVYAPKFSLPTPVVLNTWPFTAATNQAFEVLQTSRQSVLDAVEAGCNICEVQQCDFTVGYGGSPDSTGETTLDAMIMDGHDQSMGSVVYLRRVKDAIRVARKVMQHSSHSVLAGEGALAFAKMMGFHEESLTTPYSTELYLQWRANQCQPNYFKNLARAQTAPTIKFRGGWEGETIFRLRFVRSRVGDAPLPGAGCYVDNTKGAAAATGDGDIMMRFLPSYQVVPFPL